MFRVCRFDDANSSKWSPAKSVWLFVGNGCSGEDIEAYHRIKEDKTIVKFSSPRKTSEILSKKRRLKNVANDKFLLHLIQKIRSLIGF